MRDQVKKISLKEHFYLIQRGLKILNSFPKKLFLSRTLATLWEALVPFVNIYFSARILNELAGERRQETLLWLVLLTIGINLLATLIKAGLNRWKEYGDCEQWTMMFHIYHEKLLDMDFIDLENPEIQGQYDQIRQHLSGLGFGLSRLFGYYGELLKGIIQVAASVTMAVSLFTLLVPADSLLTVLNSPAVVLLVLAILSGSIVFSTYLTVKGGKIWAKSSDSNNKGNRKFSFYYFTMLQSNGAAKDIRICNQKRLIQEEIKGDGFAEWLTFAKYDSKYGMIATAITGFSNGFIYLYAALKAMGGAFGVGSIVQYVGAILQFNSGISRIFNSIGQLFNNNPFLEKSNQFLDIPNQKYKGCLSVEKREDNEYEIEFHNVTFRYLGTTEDALKNLNMKFKIGSKLAVVGMNGSGKTTMIKLLCRLYDPTEGVITLNGIDIKKYDYDEYMALFSVVFQDFQLLPFTLGQNVATSMQVDQERAAQCLEKAGLPVDTDGRLTLDTYLYKDFKEEGVEVSGGEAQKIALARALYKNSAFIILDEPTAALDPVAEYEIYSRFNEIVSEKTAVYISHRLSSCRFCNDIAVFHEGILVQRGSHDALISEESGKYHELWYAQAQYYTSESVKNNS